MKISIQKKDLFNPQEILDNIELSVVLLSSDNRVIYLNNMSEKTYSHLLFSNHDNSENIDYFQKTITDIKWLDRIKKSTSLKKNLEYVDIIIDPHNKDKKEYYRSSVQPTSSNNKLFTLLTIKNITHEIEQEKEIRSMFDNIQDGYFRCDLEGNVIFVSPSMKKFFKYKGDIKDLKGRSISEVIKNPQDMENARRLREKIGKLSDYEIKMKRYDGTELIASINSSYFHDAKGNPKGVEGTIRDITDRKSAEEQLYKLKESLKKRVDEQTKDIKEAAIRIEQAYKTKAEFVSNITHELLTPLSGILSFSELGLLKNGSLTAEKSTEYFQHINESGNRLKELIDSLISFANNKINNPKYSMSQVNLFSLIQMSINTINTNAMKKGIKIIKPDSNTNYNINADAEMIITALENILENSVKFSDSGGNIYIDIGKKDNNYTISITDEGIGVPEDEMDKIFQSFSIISNRNKVSAEGTGLGLTLAKQIIEAHSGAIRAETPANGIGLSVIITIPEYTP
ncbi:MAG: PAS domain-containing sensor histidine kinase [Gammaproteobacteria bacterium]|nr:MAG: PAS domain-containing sensor histidine kinase [Gammaproteobacteria bacterium]